MSQILIVRKKTQELRVGDRLVETDRGGLWQDGVTVTGPPVLTPCGAYAIPIAWPSGTPDTTYAYENTLVQVIA
jgi:hypothetical protein